MKRWIIYALTLIILGIMPQRGTDIGELSPVQIVWLSQVEGRVYLGTDLGNYGVGEDLQGALQNLNRSAPRMILLETVDYLIVDSGSEMLLAQALYVFRPSCMICAAPEMPEMEKVMDFLRNHKPSLTLRQWCVTRSDLQYLQMCEGRFYWREG